MIARSNSTPCSRISARARRAEQIAEVAGLVGLQLLTGSFNLIG